MEAIRKNSIVFIHTLEMVNTILIKFRNVFKIFIMMNIDKKKLNSQLLKLDEVLDVKNNWNGINGKFSEDGLGH